MKVTFSFALLALSLALRDNNNDQGTSFVGIGYTGSSYHFASNEPAMNPSINSSQNYVRASSDVVHGNKESSSITGTEARKASTEEVVATSQKTEHEQGAGDFNAVRKYAQGREVDRLKESMVQRLSMAEVSDKLAQTSVEGSQSPVMEEQQLRQKLHVAIQKLQEVTPEKDVSSILLALRKLFFLDLQYRFDLPADVQQTETFKEKLQEARQAAKEEMERLFDEASDQLQTESDPEEINKVFEGLGANCPDYNVQFPDELRFTEHERKFEAAENAAREKLTKPQDPVKEEQRLQQQLDVVSQKVTQEEDVRSIRTALNQLQSLDCLYQFFAADVQKKENFQKQIQEARQAAKLQIGRLFDKASDQLQAMSDPEEIKQVLEGLGAQPPCYNVPYPWELRDTKYDEEMFWRKYDTAEEKAQEILEQQYGEDCG